MSKLCPSCGASTLPGGRFCRVCGAPLTSAGESAEGGGVSPGARTIPLAGEGRPTSRGIKADDQPGPVVNTSKVKRSEMDDLLRRPRTEQQQQQQHAPTHKGDGSSAASDDIHRSAPPTNELTLPAGTSPAEATTPSPIAPGAASQSKPQTRTRRAWPLLVGLALALALVAGLIGYLSSRGRNQSVPFETANTSPTPVGDQKKLFDEQLAEAAALLEAGRTSEAIALLRSAIELEPTNSEAHRRLGEALEKSGERAAALEEYRISTRSDQNNAEAWRALASVQLAEGLFNDAVESYRRFITLKGETEVDDDTWLDYAQALLLAGHAEEARAVYQRVASDPKSPDSAIKAKRQLAQLPLLPSINANVQPSPREPRAGDLTQNINAEAPPPLQPTPSTAPPTPQPTVQPTPAPTPTTGDNAAQNDPDYYYNRGLHIVSGRDLKSLPRAELLQALEYFQRAQSGGTHRAEATRYVQQLGREYDRRKKQPQQ